jgi:hypothetical protein
MKKSALTLAFVLGATLPLISAVNPGTEVNKVGDSVARTSRHMATGTSHIMHKTFTHRTTGSANRVTTKRSTKMVTHRSVGHGQTGTANRSGPHQTVGR